MAVYEHTYKPYAGELTPRWSRFLILPSHSYKGIFQSKLFVGFFVLCFVYPLVASILIYLRHNGEAMAIMELAIRNIVPIDADFFMFSMMFQGASAFILTLMMGPQLISRDLTNNALPLYLCRPFSRAEYVLGKMSVLLILLSLVTWVPLLLVFFFHSSLEGWSWFTQNIRMAGAIFVGSWVLILLFSLLALALSAWVKWRLAASAALIGVFLIPSAFASALNGIFQTHWWHIISLPNLIKNAWAGLFGVFVPNTGRMRIGRRASIELFEPPLWGSWLMLIAICAFCLFLLVRKVRAYEVVR